MGSIAGPFSYIYMREKNQKPACGETRRLSTVHGGGRVVDRTATVLVSTAGRALQATATGHQRTSLGAIMRVTQSTQERTARRTQARERPRPELVDCWRSFVLPKVELGARADCMRAPNPLALYVR